MQIDIIGKGILIWLCFITFFMVQIFIQKYGDIKKNSNFFHIGPSNTLFLFGFPIDTYIKYYLLICYTIISTCVRTLHQEMLAPWIIQNIQNKNEKDSYTLKYGYFIVTVDVLFRWIDWIMYLNILLAQIDFLVVEMVGNILLALYTTKYYLHPRAQLLSFLKWNLA